MMYVAYFFLAKQQQQRSVIISKQRIKMTVK